jgi:hypothetical protein
MDLRATILAQVAAESSPTRSQWRRRGFELFAGAAAAALAIFVAAGGVRPSGRPAALIAATALGSYLLAALGLGLAATRGRSVIGRSPLALWVPIAVLPLALLLWKLGVSALYAGMLDVWPTRPGFRCLRLVLLMGAFPLAAAVLHRRGTVAVQSTTTGASLGAACGLTAAATIDLWCPVAYLPHLLLGHIGPLALLTVAGAAAGRSLLAVR